MRQLDADTSFRQENAQLRREFEVENLLLPTAAIPLGANSRFLHFATRMHRGFQIACGRSGRNDEVAV